MKTKRIVAVLVLALLLALCTVLTACGSDPIVPGDGAHEHADTPTTDTPGEGGDEAESVCLHKETEIKDKKEATCLAQGYTGDTVCSNCGKVVEEGSVTPTGSCDFEDTEVLLPATCEMVGVVKQTCSVCFAERNQSIKAAGHALAYTNVLMEGESNVTLSATHTVSCTREGCDYSEHEEEHDYSRTYNYGAACDPAGYSETTSCKGCGAKYRIPNGDNPGTAHKWGDWQVTTEPTCQTEGEETRKCTTNKCTVTETRPVEINPDAHNWSEGVTEGNVVKKECLNEGCDETKEEPVEQPVE